MTSNLKQPAATLLLDITGTTAQVDGALGQMVLHTANKNSLPVTFGPKELEALTVTLLQVSQACAEKAGVPQSISQGDDIRARAELPCDGFAVAAGEAGRFRLILRMGVFDLALSLPASTLGSLASGLTGLESKLGSEAGKPH